MINLWRNKIPGYRSNLGNIPTLIPYMIDNFKKPTGAVIIYPGGGYTHHAEHEGENIALWINKLGLHAFVLKYRIYPYRYPYPILDGKRAVRYVRYNKDTWNIQNNKIAVLGFSAGGHLASTVGTIFDNGNFESLDPIEKISSRPDAMILCYPVITFGEYSHQGSIMNLLGESPEQELLSQLSNENNVTYDTPQTFLWHTSDDKCVPVENSMLFSSALGKHNIPHELHVFRSGRHGLGLARDNPSVSIWTKLCENWLHEIDFLPNH
jgi:acetyl esterase/lipase